MTQEIKKALKINAALIDMTKTVEETLAAYSSIKINAAAVLVSDEVQKFMHKYPLKMNIAGVISAPSGCKVSMVNGQGEISPDSVVQEPTILIVNGVMTIHPGAQEAVKSYAKIIINGQVLAPQSMRGVLTGAMINGTATYYPDDATLVNGDLMIDNRFIRLAKQNESYYVTGKVKMVAANLDIQQLVEKDVYFETGCAFISESYAALHDLVSSKARIHTIPSGFEIVEDGLTIDESATLRFGKKLYVMGGVTVPYDSANFYNQFEQIIACGTITLPEATKSDWLKVISKFEGIFVYKGALVCDKPILQVGIDLLNEYADGITICDCGSVEIDLDISVDTLREKVHKLRDCGNVSCGKEQLGLIVSRSEDCGNVSAETDDADKKVNEDEGVEVVKINAALYTL